jgi:hypothetical protein
MNAAAALPLLLLATAAHAVDVYKWTDAQGVVHYGDRAPTARSGAASGAPASAATLSVPGDTRSQEEKLAAMRRLDAEQAVLRRSAATRAQPLSARRSTTPTGDSCADQWRRYQASEACFDAHRVTDDGRGVTAAGQMACPNLPQPSCRR